MRLAIFALIGLAAIGHAQKARELGPAPISGGNNGRVSAIACSPSDPNKYFVCGADGGVWKTLDGGVTYQNLTDKTFATAIGAITIDPTNENTIYVGTGEANFANHSRYGNGILRSDDDGATWVQVGSQYLSGRCISRIAVNPANPQQLFASVTPAGGFPEKAAAKNHPNRDAEVGFFHSEDRGQTWTRFTNLPNNAATDFVLAPGNPNTMYVAFGRIFGGINGIYKTTDAGLNWTLLSGGLPATTVGRIALDIAPTNANRLYALVVNSASASGANGGTKGAWRSDNGGASWTQLSIPSFQSTYGWYLCSVRVSPTNPDTAFFAGLDALRTTNTGSTFGTITAPHVDHHCFAFDASGRLLVGCDGGVFRSSNQGTNWSSINGNIGNIQNYAGLSFSPTNREFVVSGMQDNGSNGRTTASNTWTAYTGGDGGWTQLDKNNPQTFFTEYQGSGTLFRTNNGGGFFSSSGSGISSSDRTAFYGVYVIDPTNSAHMLYATQRIYESTNGGISWNPISTDLTLGAGAVRCIAISPSAPQNVYIATNDSRISYSSDGGHTFTIRVFNNSNWPRITRELTVSATHPGTVYRATWVFGGPHVQRSTDFGATWTALDGDLPDVPVNVVAVDESQVTPILYVGTDDGVFVSRNGGVNWTRYSIGIPHVPVVDLQIDAPRNRLLVSTQGRGVWEILQLVRLP